MAFSILHISDLHRDPRDEVANGPLLDSLFRDIERYADGDPRIPRPTLCIVSGDLVYGVGPDAKDADSELQRQYDQAIELLTGLANNYWAGKQIAYFCCRVTMMSHIRPPLRAAFVSISKTCPMKSANFLFLNCSLRALLCVGPGQGCVSTGSPISNFTSGVSRPSERHIQIFTEVREPLVWHQKISSQFLIFPSTTYQSRR